MALAGWRINLKTRRNCTPRPAGIFEKLLRWGLGAGRFLSSGPAAVSEPQPRRAVNLPALAQGGGARS
jgi:hypothetical protein